MSKPRFPANNLIADLLAGGALASDAFAIGLLRIELKRFPESIGTDNEAHAEYWYKYWKRSGGDPVTLKKKFAAEADVADEYLVI